MEKNRIWCTRLLELSEDISSPGDGVQYGDGERPRLMRRKEAVGDSPRVLLRVTAHLELAYPGDRRTRARPRPRPAEGLPCATLLRPRWPTSTWTGTARRFRSAVGR